MQESYGTSPSGNLKEAVRGISNPAFLILMSNAEQFETHVAELEELYPRTKHRMHWNELPDQCDGKRCQCDSI